MGLTLAGATALSAGIGAVGSLFGTHQQGQYNAKEAQKDRDFQERMYNQQVQDNINFWKMTTDFDLPSAQLARLREAGMNPLLAYGQGGNVQNVAGGTPQAAQAPSGAQASRSFNNPLDLGNLALLQAQVDNIKADTEQKKSQTAETDFDVMFKRMNAELERAIKYGTLDSMNAVIRDYNSQIWTRENLNTQQVISMAQDRLYQIKRFNLDSDYQGSMIAQGWENLKIGRIQANASVQQAAAAMIQARNAAAVGNAQIALFAQEYSFLAKANPLKLDTMTFEKLATKAGWKTEQARTFEREFKNKLLKQYGTESLPSHYTAPAAFMDQFKLGLKNLMDPRWWLAPMGSYSNTNGH